MDQMLLRSGKIADYEACGQDGAAVYRSADQIRETIRLQIGVDAAEMFAQPKVSNTDDSIDWYAATDARVVPWSSATPQEQAAAKQKLLAARERMDDISERMAASDNEQRRTFGRLLRNSLMFPGEEHVYIMNGKPVLTFWGFRRPNSSGEDPLALLKVQPGLPEPGVPEPGVPEPGIPCWRRSRLWWLLIPLLLLLLLLLLWWWHLPHQPTVEPEPIEPPDDDHTGIIEHDGRLYVDRDADGQWELLPPDFDTKGVTPRSVPPDVELKDGRLYVDRDADGQWELLPPDFDFKGVTLRPVPPDVESKNERALAAETTPSRDPLLPPDDASDGPKTEVQAEQPSPTTSQPYDPLGSPSEPLRVPREALQSDDTSVPDVQPEQPSPTTPQPYDPLGSPSEPLRVPPEALQSDDTSFLEGNWNAVTGLVDYRGRPVDVRYEFEDGQGRIEINDADGQRCSGPIDATIEDDSVVIAGRSHVACPDGSSFQASRVRCQVGSDGRADCNGENEDGATFDVLIERGGE